MPKLKTHKGAAKRFKKTGTGKVKRGKRISAPYPDFEGYEAQTQARYGNYGQDADLPKVLRMIPYQ